MDMDATPMLRLTAELLFPLVIGNPAGLIAKGDTAGMFTF
jgi:hypothetical protein